MKCCFPHIENINNNTNANSNQMKNQSASNNNKNSITAKNFKTSLPYSLSLGREPG